MSIEREVVIVGIGETRGGPTGAGDAMELGVVGVVDVRDCDTDEDGLP